MTDHETTARSIVDQILDYDQLVSAIASALREAEARERERCAEIAKNWKSSLRPGSEARLFGHQEAACEIAAAIRSTTDE